MSLEKISNQLKRKTEKEVEKIKKSAILDKEKILKEMEHTVELERRRIIDEANDIGEKERQAIISEAYLNQKKAVLKEKQNLINDIYNEIKKRVKSLPKEEYQSLVERIMVSSIETGDEEIVIGPAEKSKITPEFIDKINAKLKQNGKLGRVKLIFDNERRMDGFLVKWEKTEIDNSWDNIIKRLREKTEQKVIKVLFM